MATYFRADGWVKTALGAAVPGAQVYVCNQPANTNSAPPSPLATIFSDVNGLVPITQPIITDGFGHYDFYTSPGTYTVVIAFGGTIQQVYPDQNIGLAEPSSGSITSSGGSIVVTTNTNGSTNLDVASAGGGSVLTATVSLSSTDLKNLRSTPKTLVAGQVGKTIVPIFYELIYNFVTTPYSGATSNVFNVFPGTDITLQYDNGIRATGLVDQSVSKLCFSNSSAPNNQSTFPTSVVLSSFQGQALSLGFGQAQGPAPLSVGDGTMTAVVAYMVI